MKHLGDITKINGSEIEKVDCITFGSPCQDLSVANGNRQGLSGERSGLFMEAVRIIKEMRNNGELHREYGRTDDDIRHPRYAIWENVPGAFSSNKGEDFRVVLEELCRVKQADFAVPQCKKWSKSGLIIADDWSIAWRLFDAQYWGVPQRRKRICVLCDFDGQTAGDILLLEHFRESGADGGESLELGASGERRSEIQLEREGLPRHLESCVKTWKGIAKCPEESTGVDSYTVKIRGGVETDSQGKKAGKGALVQTELSGTMGVSQDQTLF